MEEGLVPILLARDQRKTLLALLRDVCRDSGYDDVLPEALERFKAVSFLVVRPAEGAHAWASIRGRHVQPSAAQHTYTPRMPARSQALRRMAMPMMISSVRAAPTTAQACSSSGLGTSSKAPA
jgi:hypothetical protein